jgi:hypothetical protein
VSQPRRSSCPGSSARVVPLCTICIWATCSRQHSTQIVGEPCRGCSCPGNLHVHCAHCARCARVWATCSRRCSTRDCIVTALASPTLGAHARHARCARCTAFGQPACGGVRRRLSAKPCRGCSRLGSLHACRARCVRCACVWATSQRRSMWATRSPRRSSAQIVGEVMSWLFLPRELHGCVVPAVRDAVELGCGYGLLIRLQGRVWEELRVPGW